jgi:hypothetical protein
MIPISRLDRIAANHQIDRAKEAISSITDQARNLDPKTREALNRAMDEISLAETHLANQPHQK